MIDAAAHIGPPSALVPVTREEMPFPFHQWDRIDGSTATIPLTAALIRAIEGVSPQEAEGRFTHNRTSAAYENLLAEKADLIFVTAPSTEVWDMAKGAGVELEVIPVVKDAFVFLVNAQNPVENLSLSQLRDIYAGKITNWKQVGGEDREIIPYQRPDGSGSQTLFYKHILDKSKVMEPRSQWVEGDMGGLVKAIIDYDNSQGALGYSVYYYVSSMFGREEEFRLLAVEGVAPTQETILAGDYPLEDAYFAVLRKDTPQDAPVRGLVQWLLSPSGQQVALEAGYVAKAEGPYPRASTHESRGTGGKNWLGPQAQPPENPRLSDLFYDDVNYIAYLNRELAWAFLGAFADTMYFDGAKRAFGGIPNDYGDFSLNDQGALTIYFSDSPYMEVEEEEWEWGWGWLTVPLPKELSPYGGEAAAPSPYQLDFVRLYDYSDVKPIILKAAHWGNEAELNRLIDAWYQENLTQSSDYGPNISRWDQYLSCIFSVEHWEGWREDRLVPAIIGFVLDMEKGILLDQADYAAQMIPLDAWWTLEGNSFEKNGDYRFAPPEDYVPGEGVTYGQFSMNWGFQMVVTDPALGTFTVYMRSAEVLKFRGITVSETETFATYNLN